MAGKMPQFYIVDSPVSAEEYLNRKLKLRRLQVAVVLTVLTYCVYHIFLRGNDNYKPVVIIHGVLADANSMSTLSKRIESAHPGTNVTVIDLYSGWRSITPLWTQVHKFANVVSEIVQSAADGIHLIGYSQGGLIARGILAVLPEHKVNTFISLSSPQMGQYGDTDYLRKLFPQYVKENLYKLFYRRYGQIFSVANFWNDPHHQDLYRNYSVYLAVLNNETGNVNSFEYKNNFLKLKNLVLIGGPDDGVITPWQSSHFGFYGAVGDVVEMEDQQVYKEDSFGLKSLMARKSIHTYSVPGVEHIKWHENETIFTNFILPWLT